MAATAGNIVIQDVIGVFHGTAGETASTDAGYTQGGFEFKKDEETEEVEMDQSNETVLEYTKKRTGEVTISFAEDTLALNAIALGGTVADNVLTIGDRAEISLGVEVDGPSATVSKRRWEFPYVKSTGSVGRKYERKGVNLIPVTFKCLKLDTNPVTVTDTPVTP